MSTEPHRLSVAAADLTALLRTARELLDLVHALADAAGDNASPALKASTKGMADALATRLTRLEWRRCQDCHPVADKSRHDPPPGPL